MKRPRRQKHKKNMHVFRSPNYMNRNDNIAPNPPQPNKGLCLHTNANTDEELVRNSTYKFNSSVETLINDSETSRFAVYNRKNGVKKVPRRQNAWIIYRRDKSISPEFAGTPSKFISKDIAKMWDNEKKETIELFEALARISVKKHIERYGEDYRYNPKEAKKSKQLINEDKSSVPPAPAPSSSKFEEQKNFPTPPISPISSSSSDSAANPEQQQPYLQFSTNIYFSYYTN
ncbi:hypothetical protein RhiirB3_470974 [Rhizophagus irregularis]|uniref:MATA-HMG n=1 Tax=Rhizophagus irregularis TaxID=588596 RepID=A0A1B1EU83_9GLOM|nr:MATA-HMG [Rhizophagus irregularis]PKY22579.1 hypothetical protein RhiirB3_470974 [Rhizophagus irregularis]